MRVKVALVLSLLLAADKAAVLTELRELLAIPNVASDTPNIERNADAIAEMLRKRGIEPRLLRVEGAPPVVFGELRAPNAKETLILYAHYDGQPVDRAKWASDPWTPVLRTNLIESGGKDLAWDEAIKKLDPEWRLFARSASDDKAPIVAMLAAVDELRAAKKPLRVNVKFFFEGEEEAGSPHLAAILDKHRDLLSGDLWLTSRLGHEFCVKGTKTNARGSHGSLHAHDSLSPLVVAGVPQELLPTKTPRSVDVAPLCLAVLGLEQPLQIGIGRVDSDG